MTNVEARIKIKGKNFEILVDLDKALQMKKGVPVSIENVLAVDEIFYDVKKGLKVSKADLQEYFGTEDIREAAKKIIMDGEIQLPAEYKKKQQEEKRKQIIDFLSKNCIDPTTNMPHTPTRIEEALKVCGINIDNRPINEQIGKIIEAIRKVIPIKIETKKLKIRVPALYTGRAYGLLQPYKEKEEWLSNGDLECVINLPAGLQMEFYDKLNKITQGSIIVEEIKETS